MKQITLVCLLILSACGGGGESDDDKPIEARTLDVSYVEEKIPSNSPNDEIALDQLFYNPLSGVDTGITIQFVDDRMLVSYPVGEGCDDDFPELSAFVSTIDTNPYKVQLKFDGSVSMVDEDCNEIALIEYDITEVKEMVSDSFLVGEGTIEIVYPVSLGSSSIEFKGY